MKAPLCAAAWLCLVVTCAHAQTNWQPLPALSSRDLNRLAAEYDRLSRNIIRQSADLLNDLQAKETRLYRQLVHKDSSLAATMFSPTALSPLPLKDYLPNIDSLQTALQFLKWQGLTVSSSAAAAGLLDKVKVLQEQLQKANGISAMVTERQQQLQTVLAKYDLSSSLRSYSQKAWYYKTRILQYKDLFNHPDQLTGRVLAVVRNSTAFQSYFRNNSYLSTLFRVPGSAAATAAASNNALQTRAQVDAMVAARLGKGANFASAVAGQTNSNNSGNPLAGNMGQAQSALNALKTRVAQQGGGGSTTPIPDFQPNTQHNQSLWKRLEFGFNIQSTHTTPLIPAITDLAFTLGYKASDRLVVGVGGGYKLGWGSPFNHISLSGQGASIRSFINWKIKGSIWLAGGYEFNYYNAFSRFDQLAPLQAWQRSGLIGLQKSYKVGKRTGNIQLLWDFLSQQEIPQPQPLIFRVGYTL